MTCDLLIRHVDVLQLEPGAATVLADQCLVIDGPLITAVGPAAELAHLQARRTLDGGGRLAMPGFINTHAHTPMVLFRGLAEDLSIERWFNEVIWPLEGRLTPEDVYWGALLALIELIESGVTTVTDHYLFMDGVAQAVEQSGIRGELGQTYFSSQGPAGLEQGAAFAQRWQGRADGRIRTWLAPHAPYTCDDETLRASAERARTLNLGVHIHAAENLQQTQASLEKRGQTPIEVLDACGVLDGRTLIAHGCGLLPGDIERLSPRRDHLGVAHAPATYLRLAMGLTPLRALRDAGIAVGLASDGVPSNANADPFQAMRLTAMLQKHERRDAAALPVSEALWMATLGGAAALGRPAGSGSLRPGQAADLILIDLTGTQHQPLHNVPASLVYNALPSEVQSVVVNGQVVMQDRHLLTLDKPQILAEVNARSRRLLREQGRPVQIYTA